ncbi:MAG: DEAD/DEAH box helicase family protein [Phycisphaerae bacterium]
MNLIVNAIANRLSLRPPQRDSLEILARVWELIKLEKGADTAAELEAIRAEFPAVTDFERDFPSLCFALATGVGKTRLMGAFIAYLYQSEGIRDFFVLAPNLTIYNKLIADFTPNSPKYVFKGIAEFAQMPPEIITGDNYEAGRGMRGRGLFADGANINIFNISKINSEVRGGNAPRIKRLSEYLGQSYFDYLAGLDDLVVLMDESHRYRASAGVRAINELKPILGLELTATPQVETGGRSAPFKNVIYSYPLAVAMQDGFVKEPAVVTRINFDPGAYSPEGLERLKLEDGVRIHEDTKVQLEVYARNNDRPIVKPFMLVVATDTAHANALQQLMEGDEFFGGRYKGKVLQVHSNIRGEEKDDVVQQLLTVEHPDNPVEIVIHVNMLKEGWDVTNLFTIVPLRAANSRTLVEQSIGRGLRLPYGRRTGVAAVDRLTIVSHDKFKEIVDHAADPNSIIRVGLVIGRDIPEAGRRAVPTKSVFEGVISGGTPQPAGAAGALQGMLFNGPQEQEVARATYDIIRQYEGLRGSDQLLDEKVQREIVEKVQARVRPVQGVLEGIVESVDVAAIVGRTTAAYRELSIDVPKIVLSPVGEVECRYEDFDLDVRNINYQPVAHDILIRHLREDKQYTLVGGSGVIKESRPEDYLIRGLIDFNDIDYDRSAPLLYKLAGQVVAKLRNYLKSEEDVENVLQYHQRTLVELIHSQMQPYFVQSAPEFKPAVTKGFITLRARDYLAAADEAVRDFRLPIPEGERSRIGAMVFGGFHKCLYPVQKFDSDPERRFAAVLERDGEVLKWFRPGTGDISIYYPGPGGDLAYEPDFIVEAAGAKYICEIKRSDEMDDAVVQQKAAAAREWCRAASEHARENHGKPWEYLLIPHDRVQEQMTFSGLAATSHPNLAPSRPSEKYPSDAGAPPGG